MHWRRCRSRRCLVPANGWDASTGACRLIVIARLPQVAVAICEGWLELARLLNLLAMTLMFECNLEIAPAGLWRV